MGTPIYTLSVADMTEEVYYADRHTVVEYENVDDAIEAAKKVAKILNTAYPQCFCVSVMAGEERDDEGNITGEPTDIYTVSSKTKGETMRARKLAHYVLYEADDYIDSITSVTKPSIYVLTVVTLNSEGMMDFTTEKYGSFEEADGVAKTLANKWMQDNDLEEVNDRGGHSIYTKPCTRENYGNFIEIQECDSIAEFNSCIYQFSLE